MLLVLYWQLQGEDYSRVWYWYLFCVTTTSLWLGTAEWPQPGFSTIFFTVANCCAKWEGELIILYMYAIPINCPQIPHKPVFHNTLLTVIQPTKKPHTKHRSIVVQIVRKLVWECIKCSKAKLWKTGKLNSRIFLETYLRANQHSLQETLWSNMVLWSLQALGSCPADIHLKTYSEWWCHFLWHIPYISLSIVLQLNSRAKSLYPMSRKRQCT